MRLHSSFPHLHPPLRPLLTPTTHLLDLYHDRLLLGRVSLASLSSQIDRIPVLLTAVLTRCSHISTALQVTLSGPWVDASVKSLDISGTSLFAHIALTTFGSALSYPVLPAHRGSDPV